MKDCKHVYGFDYEQYEDSAKLLYYKSEFLTPDIVFTYCPLCGEKLVEGEGK